MARSTTTARSSRPAAATSACTATASPATTAQERSGGFLSDRVRFAAIDNLRSAQTSLVNAGTIRKTAGTGTSTLLHQRLHHQHRHHRGRLRNPLSRRQLHHPDFRRHADRRHLECPRRRHSAIPQRHGHHQQRRQPSPSAAAGATIAGIAGLASNSGSFVVTDGADFTTAGNFTNSGSLTVGAGSIFTVGRQLHPDLDRHAQRPDRRHARERPLRAGRTSTGRPRWPGSSTSAWSMASAPRPARPST